MYLASPAFEKGLRLITSPEHTHTCRKKPIVTEYLQNLDFIYIFTLCTFLDQELDAIMEMRETSVEGEINGMAFGFFFVFFSLILI